MIFYILLFIFPGGLCDSDQIAYGLSRGLLGLYYDRINYSDSDSDSAGITNFDLRRRFVGVGFCMCFRLASLPTSSKGMLADRICLANWRQPTGSRAVFRFLSRS